VNSRSAKSVASEPGQRKAGTSHDDLNDFYGRRVEADRSWTVYHVFTGVPASLDGRAMVGLGRAAATDRMLDLNRRNSSSQVRRIHLIAPSLDASDVGTLGWP
jgi:hypothetical protein